MNQRLLALAASPACLEDMGMPVDSTCCRRARWRDAGRCYDAALQIAAALESGRIVDVDGSLALDASRLDLPLTDSLIYATARRLRATVWTQDEDFNGLESVRYFAK